MSTDRAVIAWQTYQASAEKYDYFMLGLASALTAYIGQHLSSVRPGVNAPTLEAAALVLLAGAVLAALLRLRASIVEASIQARVLNLSHRAGQIRTQLAKGGSGLLINEVSGQVLNAAQAAVEAQKAEARKAGAEEARAAWSRRAHVAYWARDLMLAGGVAGYAVAKVWGTLAVSARV